MGGIAGPVLFISTVAKSASLRNDYSHISHFVSERGATGTNTEQLMNFAGFVPSGVLISLFGMAILSLSIKKPMPVIGSILIILFGTGMALAGLFSCDLGCRPADSFESIVHDRISAITFMSAIIGILVSGFSFNHRSFFRKFSRYSKVTGLVSFALLIVMISSFDSRNLTGLWQRLLLLSLFLWTSRIGLHIFKNSE